MLFNSFEFLAVFLPLTFFLYFFSARFFGHSQPKLLLVIASLIFYGYFNPVYVALIGVSIILNFYWGNRLLVTYEAESNEKHRKLILFSAIGFNLALLGYFKYCDFFIENVNTLTNSNIPIQNIVLPLAISFFTFQQISFLTERYKGQSERYSFLDYSLFVVFFPQLIAGPIVQPKNTLHQFADKAASKISSKHVFLGLSLFGIGLFKKVIVADSLVQFVGLGFDTHSAELNSIDAWLVAIAYSFQLYFDFSGYTDMALGLGLLFNIKLPINFNSPYRAVNIQDFWRRWHITLSNFLRDYLYIPLGGNRVGNFRIYANLFTTFLLGGLWHGAGWTFVIWGALHGAALCLHRLWSKLNFQLPKILSWTLTMIFVITAWVFFRATDLDLAMNIVSSMYNVSNIITEAKFFVVHGYESIASGLAVDMKTIFIQLVLCLLIVLLFTNSTAFIYSYLNDSEKRMKIVYIFFLALLFASGVLFISLQEYTEFIYFNF